MLRDRPACRSSQHRQKCRQHNQRHADAIHAEQVFDAKGLNPRQFHHGLHSRFAKRKLGRADGPKEPRHSHPERQPKHNGRGEQSHPSHKLFSCLGNDWQREDSRHERRQKHNSRQRPESGLIQREGRGHGSIRRGFCGREVLSVSSVRVVLCRVS